MDPPRKEDPNHGPERAKASTAGADGNTPIVTGSAITTYSESPLVTLRKRDLEYRRLHHANSPEQRDQENKSATAR